MVTTRMAPSPTGEYHIGHIRTLLYNWALARQQKGKFIVRIEDTDRNRFVEGADKRILKVIEDYGFNWDEGPVYQSDRLEIYKKYADELVEKKAAYYCFCSSERLAKMREDQQKSGASTTKYDRHCLSLTSEEIKNKLDQGEEYVIRILVPDNQIAFEDQVFGKIQIHGKDIDDQVLLKSDGFPTYHFAVVVDDHLMGVTHIMRGNDWLPSTPKHVILYEAFGWEKPVWAHLPNLKELGGSKKLSKRFGAVQAREFLDEGYLPEALLNFLMFLGWNPGTDKEIYTIDEFVADFKISKVHKTDLVAFDRKKLDWFNSQYIQRMTDESFASFSMIYLDKRWSKEMFANVLPLVKSRIKKFGELDDFVKYFLDRVDPIKLTDKYSFHLKAAVDALKQIEIWDLDNINGCLTQVIEQNGFKTGDFYMDLRGTIAGSKATPPINESMEILGKDEILARLETGLAVYT